MTNKFDIEDAIYQLGVLLMDESQGLLLQTLKKNFDEAYKDFDTITAWECFVEEVNRINKVCELHDFLVDVDWEMVLTQKEDKNDK